MNYIVNLYNQTGFNSCNVPESAAWVLNNLTPFKSYDNFELVQGRYLATLRIQLDAISANRIDLIAVTSDSVFDTTIYVVNSYTMVAPDVCEFNLLLEPYSTLGGFTGDSGNLILGGTAKRVHVSTAEDLTNFYILDEPFQNREPIEWSVNRISPTSTYIRLIETLSIPSQIIVKNSLIRAIEEGKVDVAQYSDSNISRNSATIGAFLGYDKDSTAAYTYQYMETAQPRYLKSTIYKCENTEITLGTRWWRADNIDYEIEVYKVKNESVETEKVKGSLISDLVSDGRASDITTMWEVPLAFFTGRSSQIPYKPEVVENSGGYDEILSLTKTGAISLNKWAATTYNNKINYGQNIIIKVYNPSSSTSVEHKVFEVKAPNTAAGFITSIPITLKADLRPSGSPLFMFTYLNSADNVTNMIETLQGGEWRKLALTETGVQTKIEALQQNNMNELYSYDAQTQITNQIANGISSIVSIIGNAMQGNFIGGLQTGIGALQGQYNSDRAIWRNNIVNVQQNNILNTRAATASVNITRASCNYATDTDKNAFYAIVSHFSNGDLIAFDTFLTKYGYNVGNLPIDNTYFNNRPAYNFVQVNDMQVESVRGNRQLVDDTIERLKQGLRIWHKKPNAADLLASGNR